MFLLLVDILLNARNVPYAQVAEAPAQEQAPQVDPAQLVRDFVQAAARGDVARLQELVEQGVDINGAGTRPVNRNGVETLIDTNALNEALLWIKDDAALYLLSLENITVPPNALVTYASRGKNIDVVNALINKRIDVNYREGGNTALNNAISNENEVIALKLLTIDDIDMRGHGGYGNVIHGLRDRVESYGNNPEYKAKMQRIYDAVKAKNAGSHIYYVN